MNFKRFRVSKNLLNQTVPPQNIYITDSIRRMGYEVAVPAGTYTAYGNNADLYAKTKINGVYGGASQINTPLTLTLSSDGSIIIYSRANGEFPDVNIMLNSGSEALPYEPYSSEVWHDIPHYIHKTDTDTITTLPAVVYPNDTTATVGLKGQAVQSTTPTPQNPVMPQGTGERTGNLFDYATQAEDLEHHTAKRNFYLNSSGDEQALTSWWISDYIEINSDTVTVCQVGGNTPAICCYDSNKEYIRGQAYMTGGAQVLDNITLNTSGAKYVRFSFFRPVSGGLLMLVEGSTAPTSYIPFGYKIPISSAGQTTPVYLGEVETTRKIKKYECTGNESWSVTSAQGKTRAVANFTTSMGIVPLSKVVSTHYTGVEGGAGYPDINTITVNNNGTMIIGISSEFIDSNAWKSYLAQQYAAGTPVTVWYVLQEPETGIVNEPLMKIGDYADEVSNITIPVTAGGDTLSVDTTVQPSEITVNYKGWHPVLNVHERDNGAWT